MIEALVFQVNINIVQRPWKVTRETTLWLQWNRGETRALFNHSDNYVLLPTWLMAASLPVETPPWALVLPNPKCHDSRLPNCSGFLAASSPELDPTSLTLLRTPLHKLKLYHNPLLFTKSLYASSDVHSPWIRPRSMKLNVIRPQVSFEYYFIFIVGSLALCEECI